MQNNLKNKNILVTGGAGFIGSALVRQLVAAGANVTVIDNLINGKRENLEEIKNVIHLEVLDIRQISGHSSLLNKIDIVYHLACLGVRHSIHSPLENHDVNASGTLALLECAYKNHVKRFVYVSSSEVYGTARWTPMTEEHPTFPHTVYGSSKLAGECYARAFHDTYDYPTVIVRPFNAFGPRCHHEGDSGEVIPKFMLRSMTGKPMIIFGDGTQRRDFTFVSDTARGILLAGLIDEAIGQTINLGSGSEIDINSLAKEISFVLGHKEPFIKMDKPRQGDVLRLCADNTKAGKLLGYEPQITLRDGLSQLHDWYQATYNNFEILLAQEKVHNWQKDEKSHVS